MILIEQVLLGIVLFAIGITTGEYTSNNQKAKTADIWPPNQHQEMLRQCAISCGEGGLQSYNTSYGICQCKNLIPKG